MTDTDYLLKFNGCPVFHGTYEECVAYMSKEYPTTRLQGWCQICSPEQSKELAESKKIIDSAVTRHQRSHSFSADGSVEYYD